MPAGLIHPRSTIANALKDAATESGWTLVNLKVRQDSNQARVERYALMDVKTGDTLLVTVRDADVVAAS